MKLKKNMNYPKKINIRTEGGSYPILIGNNILKKFNKKIEGKVVIDKNIIGGTKIIVGDSVIDASVRAQLDNLAFTLKA